MKKILFVVPSFSNGGTMSSIKNMLPWLSEKDCSIDVFAITNKGPNYDAVAKYSHVLGTRLDDENESVKSKNTRINSTQRFLFGIVYWVKKQLCKIGIDISGMVFKRSVAIVGKKRYDIVIAFQEGQATKYVSYFNNAKKIAWIRCDYSRLIKGTQKKSHSRVYSKIDRIVCVSEYTKEVFTSLLPETKNKTIAIHNLINIDRIKNSALETENLDARFAFEGFRIVSLGRIDPVKQFSFIPVIAKQLIEKGCRFKWYIIGGKAVEKEFDLLVYNTSQYGVADNVILLGEISNPYPYIKQADLVVCTSLSEACPNVINEAKIIHTPIVSTNFGSAKEFITDGVNGLLSPIETIADKIEMMINDKNVYNHIVNNISKFEYDNEEISETLKQLLLCQ